MHQENKLSSPTHSHAHTHKNYKGETPFKTLAGLILGIIQQINHTSTYTPFQTLASFIIGTVSKTHLTINHTRNHQVKSVKFLQDSQDPNAHSKSTVSIPKLLTLRDLQMICINMKLCGDWNLHSHH